MEEEVARSQLGTLIASSLARREQTEGAAVALEVDAAVDELLPLWRVESEVAHTPGKIGALLPYRYVIPDQDLKLVDTMFSVFAASAAVSYFIPQIGFDPAKGVVAAITGITVALLRMLHNLKLAVHLEKCDHAIVVALTASRPKGLSAPAILKGLQSSFPQMTVEEVERRLQALTSCATVSGTKTAVVWKDGNGDWHDSGV